MLHLEHELPRVLEEHQPSSGGISGMEEDMVLHWAVPEIVPGQMAFARTRGQADQAAPIALPSLSREEWTSRQPKIVARVQRVDGRRWLIARRAAVVT